MTQTGRTTNPTAETEVLESVIPVTSAFSPDEPQPPASATSASEPSEPSTSGPQTSEAVVVQVLESTAESQLSESESAVESPVAKPLPNSESTVDELQHSEPTPAPGSPISNPETAPSEPAEDRVAAAPIVHVDALHRAEKLRKFWRLIVSRLLENALSWLFAGITGLWLLFTFLYGWATSSPTGTLGSLISSVQSPTVVIRTLRVLTEGVSILLTALVAASTGLAPWITGSTDRGVTVSTWLAMSASTHVVGLLQLLWWPCFSKSRSWDLHIPWVLVR